MKRCQEAMGEEFPEKLKPNSKAPWNDALLKTDNDLPLLSEQKSETFRALAMKGILLAKRSRPDVEPGLRFFIKSKSLCATGLVQTCKNHVVHARNKR